MKKHIFFVTIVFFLHLATYAQWGSVDTTFNPGDQGFGYGDGAEATVQSSVIQSDGKILIVGSFAKYNGTISRNIARLYPNGDIDNTFNIGSGANGIIYASAIQTDEKILIGGDFTSFNGTSINRIARLNSDGSIDTSFHVGTGIDDLIFTIKIQNDGKIIIGGEFITYNGTSVNRIVRLNNDGSIDTSFNIGTGANNYIRAIEIQSDEKIIIGGDFTTFNGANKYRIARLNSNGSNDGTFNTFSGMEDPVFGIAIQSDGKVIIVGEFGLFQGFSVNGIVRLNTNGTKDVTFSTGTGFNNTVYSPVIQSDGKIIIGGAFSNYNGYTRNYLVRLNSNGSIDLSFNPGEGPSGWISSISNYTDGKIIITGGFELYRGIGRHHIACLNTDSSFDESFNKGTGADNVIMITKINSNGKVLICGTFKKFNNYGRNQIALLNSDGTIDTTFNPGTGINGSIWDAIFQNDGKVIVCGNFSEYNGIATNNLIRINTDGCIDNSFNIGTGPSSGVYSLAIQTDGKIIIGGGFSSFNGISIKKIARLNSDGSLDNSFNPGIGPNGGVFSIAIQNDGKYIIGGQFNTYVYSDRNCIARINIDGSLDESFDPGTSVDNTIETVELQSDGKILIGGYFNSYNGVSIKNLARLNSDGSLDASFYVGTGANNGVFEISEQTDGKILIGGEFTYYNGVNKKYFVRLNNDGSIDNLFIMGSGPSYKIRAIEIQNDGKIIIGGEFVSYNGVGRNRIARLLACSEYYSSESIDICEGESYNWHGIDYETTGIYYDTITNFNGCESEFQLLLNINYKYLYSDTASICGGESFNWRGIEYNTSGVYYDSLITNKGCDSIFMLVLIVNPSYSFSEAQSICVGDVYTWQGMDYTSTGVYYNNLTSAFGCDSLFQLDLTTYFIDTSVSYSGNNLYSNFIADSYQWVDCDDGYSSIPGAHYPIFSASENGNYAIILTMGSCSDTSSCIPVTSVEVASNQFENEISIYPVPFSDEITIEDENDFNQWSFKILNALGQVVYNGNVINKTIVQTEKFASGVYFVRFENDNSFFYKKIIK